MGGRTRGPKLGAARQVIHLYAWIDEHTPRIVYFVPDRSNEQTSELCKLLNVKKAVML